MEIGNDIEIRGKVVRICKYGENAWQTPAALLEARGSEGDPLAITNFKVIEGDPPSYNNYIDIDRLLQTMTHIVAGLKKNEIDRPFVAVGAKHGNACGAAAMKNIIDAMVLMVTGDTRAIMGGLVMVNFDVDDEAADILMTTEVEEGQKRLFDGVIAPSFTPQAIDILKRKSGKCRLIVNPALANLDEASLDKEPRFRCVRGGFLVQPNYIYVPDFKDPRIKHHGNISGGEWEALMPDLLLAWAIGSTSNSNTITLVKDGQLLGNGVGQQDRVGAAELAEKRARDAGHQTAGSVAYSDSFFPFDDGVRALWRAGIRAVFTSSGSVNDDQVIEYTSGEKSMTLVMVPDEVGRGFYGH